jgi:hypothetical protein
VAGALEAYGHDALADVDQLDVAAVRSGEPAEAAAEQIPDGRAQRLVRGRCSGLCSGAVRARGRGPAAPVGQGGAQGRTHSRALVGPIAARPECGFHRGAVSGLIVGALVGWLLVLFGVMTPRSRRCGSR